MLRTIPLALCLLMMPPSNIFGDLYQETAMSLEWIVDSADVFYVVRVDAIDPNTKRVTKVKSVSQINKPAALADSTLPAAETWKHKLLSSQLGDEWLLGVRGTGESTRVFRGINLTRPTYTWQIAAIALENGVVKVLETKREILAAVQRRIRLDTELPKHCVRRCGFRPSAHGSQTTLN